MDKRRRVKEESREAGSRRAHRAAKQIFVDIEQGFRTALRGFREFEYAIREDDGWVRKLREEPHAQARLNRAVDEHRQAAHRFVTLRRYEPWSVKDHSLLVDLYERSDDYLRSLGLVRLKSPCEYGQVPPEVTKVRNRHIWHGVKPFPRTRNVSLQCGKSN
jgi:hypothetical protein